MPKFTIDITQHKTVTVEAASVTEATAKAMSLLDTPWDRDTLDISAYEDDEEEE